MTFKNKHEYVQHEIKKMIREQDMKPHDKLPSELEFQTMFNVSRHTVRTALSRLENTGVIYKEQGSGSFVSDGAIKSSSKEIGVITTYISDYIFPTIIRGIEKELTQAGYSMILTSTNNNVMTEKNAIEMLLKRDIDGLIVEPTKSSYYNSNIGTYLHIIDQDIPIMMINASYEEINTPMVALDDYQASYDLTKYLIDNGHTEIGGIFKIDDKQGKERLRGFIQACYEFGVEYNSNHVLVYETETLQEILHNQANNIVKNKSVSAFVCYNDKVAVDLLNIIWQHGYNVPEDFSIVSHDNSNLAGMTKVHLTGIDHPKSLLGEEAARRLLDYIEGKTDIMETKIFKGEFVENNSVKNLLSNKT